MIKKILTMSLALSIVFTSLSFQHLKALVVQSEEQVEAIEKKRKVAQMLQSAQLVDPASAALLRKAAEEMNAEADKVAGVDSFETTQILNDEIVEKDKAVKEAITAAKKLEEEEAKAAAASADVVGGVGADEKQAPWYRRWFNGARGYAAEKARQAKAFVVRNKTPLIIGGVLTAAGLAAYYKRKELRSAFDAAKADGFSGSYKQFAQLIAKSMPNTETLAGLISGTWGAVGRGAGYINSLRGYMSNVTGAVSTAMGMKRFFSADGKKALEEESERDAAAKIEPLEAPSLEEQYASAGDNKIEPLEAPSLEEQYAGAGDNRIEPLEPAISASSGEESEDFTSPSR